MVVSVLGGIVLFTGLLTFVAIRSSRASDAASLAIKAENIRAECGALLVGPDFLWGVWQDTAKAAAMKFFIRDASDTEVTTVTKVAVPLDGVLQHFVLEGLRYEISKLSPMSKRTVLRKAGSDAVLLAADHYLNRTEFFRGDGENALCVVPQVSVLRRFRPIKLVDEEIGKVIVGLKGNWLAVVMTLPEGRYSELERVFVFASR